MNKIDFKTGHRELLNRRTDHWQDGWSKPDSWGWIAVLVVVIAIVVFL